MTNKPYGSGYFGEWITDAFGLPAYRYTCDQASDPRAVTPTNPLWRRPTNHVHQVGNDRIIGVASNYGYVHVRQDEGSPKYINEFNPAQRRYAGGIGYLTDGSNMLSTFYSGQAWQKAEYSIRMATPGGASSGSILSTPSSCIRA